LDTCRLGIMVRFVGLTGVPPAAFTRTVDLSDPRAQRTRALLLAEFERQLALHGEMPTVASLVRDAGVSRSSFYSHFTSIEELPVAAVRSALDQLGERDTEMRREDDVPGVNVARMTYGAFFAHIAGHRHLYAALVATGESSARAELREALVLQTQHSIEAIPGHRQARQKQTPAGPRLSSSAGSWRWSSSGCAHRIRAGRTSSPRPSRRCSRTGLRPPSVFRSRSTWLGPPK